MLASRGRSTHLVQSLWGGLRSEASAFTHSALGIVGSGPSKSAGRAGPLPFAAAEGAAAGALESSRSMSSGSL